MAPQIRVTVVGLAWDLRADATPGAVLVPANGCPPQNIQVLIVPSASPPKKTLFIQTK